ncbi:tRNA glutamyl-Q(34) synthetase GluQRS [Sandaracinobacter neustonicus]|uniref:tRNA glutamyl-Q(34) synthetase GluQRS n=2 Tax=Sandaracinobacter neustonicus TaxID=1715348 RepID=A0A501XHJ6_9SPHN|nr:tRNA glutamyl-Q(34) synthetase GluQRS [Sandaracinobacter neustonicus]TPE60082.1 tRNA glutamyl-Q(34) synthetase GluQRS [Sandaracinobacter neustonicus]
MQPAEVVSRFAPSPSGLLHLGHGLSAVLGERLARETGGRWLLRIEDIDSSRCRPDFVQAIHDDLAWLGLKPDAVSVQSARRAAHQAALDLLTAMGLTYPCFCTRADIAAAVAAPHGSQPLYPGTCRGLSAAEAARRAATRDPAIRLDVAKAAARAGPLTWAEAGLGEQPADPLAGGDIVLARKDIGVGYMLACVVDDAEDGVTDIVRGRDLIESTPVQRLLQALLGHPAPRYHHHRLLLAPDGRRLAKRDKADTLASLRETGVDGPALAARLAALDPHGPDIAILFHEVD